MFWSLFFSLVPRHWLLLPDGTFLVPIELCFLVFLRWRHFFVVISELAHVPVSNLHVFFLIVNVSVLPPRNVYYYPIGFLFSGFHQWPMDYYNLAKIITLSRGMTPICDKWLYRKQKSWLQLPTELDTVTHRVPLLKLLENVKMRPVRSRHENKSRDLIGCSNDWVASRFPLDLPKARWCSNFCSVRPGARVSQRNSKNKPAFQCKYVFMDW